MATTTWQPPATSATIADTIRRAADLIYSADIAITGHPAYDPAGITLDQAVDQACHGNRMVIDIATAVLDLAGVGMQPGYTTDTIVADLRAAADQREASAEHRAELRRLGDEHRGAVLTDGVAAWAAEWAADHVQPRTADNSGPLAVDVAPGLHVRVAKGLLQSPHGDLGYRARAMDWAELVATAKAVYTPLTWQRCRDAVRRKLDELTASIATSLIEQPPVEPVGATEIAARLGVQLQTVQNWQARPGAHFPAPRWTVGGRPAWSWSRDIAPWALATGRLRA